MPMPFNSDEKEILPYVYNVLPLLAELVFNVQEYEAQYPDTPYLAFGFLMI